MKELQTNTELSAALPVDLKNKNYQVILNTFRSGEPMSANDVAQCTGISRQTVMKAISRFMKKGLLTSAGKGASTETGGKKPELFQFTMEKYLLCIGLEHDNMNLSVYNLKGGLTAKKVQRYPINSTIEEFFYFIDQLSSELLSDIDGGYQKMYGVSLFTGGIVDHLTGTLRFFSLFPAWGHDIPLKQMLLERFPEAVIEVDNVAKMSACAAVLDNPLFEDKRVVTIYSDDGISGCFIDKGHVLHGANTLIGEVGHMVLDLSDKEECGCGSYGCFERLVSKERICSMAYSEEEKLKQSSLTKYKDELTLENVFCEADNGDEYARELTAYAAGIFCFALRNISLNFDPEVVILQGTYAYAGQWFDECLKKRLREFLYYPKEDAFTVQYDKRPLMELQMMGATKFLTHRFFSAQEWN